MNAGFYYHVEGVFDQPGTVRVPGFLGKFLVELAKQTGQITNFLHETPGSGIERFELPSELVRCVNMGRKRSAPARTLWPGEALRAFRRNADGLDVMLVRGPSPLLPALVNACQACPVTLLIVNDYLTGIEHLPQPTWRKLMIRLWAELNYRQQARAAGQALVLVNSPALQARLARTIPNLVEVFTSSLSEADIAASPKGTLNDPLRLLYAGRIDATKGLFELVEAAAQLRAAGQQVTLEVAGWSAARDQTQARLVAAAREQGVGEAVRFVGYVESGSTLLAWLREGDLFVIPSYAEGFPRAILDSMAAGVPVIATKVGGIPHRLEHGRTAYLIEPHSAEAIAQAVRQLAGDAELRLAIAANGLHWVRQYTLEKSCHLIASNLKTVASAKGRTTPILMRAEK